MYQTPRNLILAASIALALGVPSAVSQAASTSQEVTDARREAQIWTTYALSPYLRANDIRVLVHGHKATLKGVVEEEVNKALAAQIALGVDGIREVDNQIEVKADYQPPKRVTTAPSYGEFVDDASITAAVKSKLLWSQQTDGLSTEVETRLGVVTLTGSADTQQARQFATRLARDTRGVVGVRNELVVDRDEPGAKGKANAAVKRAGHDVADGWITTKVKSSYLYSSDVAGSDIKVETERGVVTLSGKVDSGAERALAIELAQNIRGVRNVRAGGLTH